MFQGCSFKLHFVHQYSLACQHNVTLNDPNNYFNRFSFVEVLESSNIF